MGYRITTVSRLTGIPRNTLLAWERRYGLVEPGRSENGYRDYSEADVDYLRRIKQLIDSGHKISEAISLLADAAREGRLNAGSKAAADLGRMTHDLVDALVSMERPRAEGVLRRADMYSFEQRVRDLFLPSLREVGDRWRAGEVSIAQEHFATAFLRERLLAVLVGLGFGPVHAPRVVCACVAGERHDGGLLGLAARLAIRGHRVVWLGSDLPAEEVVRAADQGFVRMVCLSAVTEHCEDGLLTFVDTVREGLRDDCRLVVGGALIHPSKLPQREGVEWIDCVDTFLEALDNAEQSRA